SESGAERATEHEDEQEQEDDRHPDQVERHRRVAEQVLELPADHRQGIGERVGVHDAVTLSFLGWPVRVRNTSSRSGVCTDNSSTSIDSSSSRSSSVFSARILPSLGTCRVRASSSRTTSPRVCAADSSPRASWNRSSTWPPGI